MERLSLVKYLNWCEGDAKVIIGEYLNWCKWDGKVVIGKNIKFM